MAEIESSSKSAGPRHLNHRNWAELPEDVTASILSRLRTIDILMSAQKVCKAWHKICKQPRMWATIDMRNPGWISEFIFEEICRHAVDRSAGNLVSLHLELFCSNNLLKYISHRSSRIRHLQLLRCENIADGVLSEVAMGLPLLEDLEISYCFLSHKPIKVFGRSCPLLKSLRLNKKWQKSPDHSFNDVDAIAIAENMNGLHHLQLIGNKLTNNGLKEILDCCPDLESLDLRQCFNLNLEADLGRRCAQQINKLGLPNDAIDYDYEFMPTYGVSDENEDSGFSYRSMGLVSMVTIWFLMIIGGFSDLGFSDF